MNKEHWNTVNLEGELSKEKIVWLVDLSYDLVFKKLTKKEQQKMLEK